MADISVTVAKVKPQEQAKTIRGTIGEIMTVGCAVYLNGTSGWYKGDADAAASGQVRGILASLPNGATTAAVGNACDIVTEGLVDGFSGMTPGGAVFCSTVAGALDQTAPPGVGDFVFAIGWANTATQIYVSPQITVPTATPS